MSSDELLVTDDGPIRTITLNRPEAKNTLSATMMNGLVSALSDAAATDSVRLIVLTNTGNTFCAGADLTAERIGVSGVDSGVTLADLFEAIRHSPVPVIGRIDGHAVGGGVGLVAACDLSYMRSDAKIGFTEVRLGVAPAVISVVCLPKMNRSDAMEAFLTGERFSPERAAQMGLINRAVVAEELAPAVDEVAGKILLGGPAAVRAAKEIVNTVPGMDQGEAYAEMTELSQNLFDSDEATAGIAAFRNRQPAPWCPPT